MQLSTANACGSIRAVHRHGLRQIPRFIDIGSENSVPQKGSALSISVSLSRWVVRLSPALPTAVMPGKAFHSASPSKLSPVWSRLARQPLRILQDASFAIPLPISQTLIPLVSAIPCALVVVSAPAHASGHSPKPVLGRGGPIVGRLVLGRRVARPYSVFRVHERAQQPSMQMKHCK